MIGKKYIYVQVTPGYSTDADNIEAFNYRSQISLTKLSLLT